MVRLLLGTKQCMLYSEGGFNPTMVRLLPNFFINISGLFTSFNPTMVRLLPNCHADCRLVTSVSIPQWCDCCWQVVSNFCLVNIVSIPQWCDCCKDADKRRWDAQQFQSHNGAIAAQQLQRGEIDMESFNPTMVRLLPAPSANSSPCGCLVSIPQWCDCCLVCGFR